VTILNISFYMLLRILSSQIENESKHVRGTGYLIYAHIDNEVTTRLIKGQLELH